MPIREWRAQHGRRLSAAKTGTGGGSAARPRGAVWAVNVMGRTSGWEIEIREVASRALMAGQGAAITGLHSFLTEENPVSLLDAKRGKTGGNGGKQGKTGKQAKLTVGGSWLSVGCPYQHHPCHAPECANTGLPEVATLATAA